MALDYDDQYLAELDLVAEQGYTEGRDRHVSFVNCIGVLVEIV